MGDLARLPRVGRFIRLFTYRDVDQRVQKAGLENGRSALSVARLPPLHHQAVRIAEQSTRACRGESSRKTAVCAWISSEESTLPAQTQESFRVELRRKEG